MAGIASVRRVLHNSFCPTLSLVCNRLDSLMGTKKLSRDDLIEQPCVYLTERTYPDAGCTVNGNLRDR